LNGIVLVSSVLHFGTVLFAAGDDLPYIVNFPSCAVVAEYLRALPRGKVDDLAAFMAEVEAWSLNDYAPALLAGSMLDPASRTRVIDRMHEYTGLDREFIDRANLRVTAEEFEAQLLRDRGLVVGRLDARFTGHAGDLLSPAPSHDPLATAISSAYLSAFNTYLRVELGYDGPREYVPNGGIGPWKWARKGEDADFQLDIRPPNVSVDLADAMRRNPRLQVLLINGIYDLATPYFATVWTFNQLGLPPDLRANIERVDFAAGHMTYTEEPLLPKWREALAGFVQRTSGPRPAS
jgi:carboxypeptidase C (cathepsin A)